MIKVYGRKGLTKAISEANNNCIVSFEGKTLIIKKEYDFFDYKKECPKCYFEKFNTCYDYYSSVCACLGHFEELSEIEKLVLLGGEQKNDR